MTLKPFGMILSLARDTLFAETHVHFLQSLHTRAHITSATTAADVLQHLNTSDLTTVLVTDCQISEPSFQEVLMKLIKYAKSGRPVVIGGTFSSFMQWPDFPAFFGTSWGVQWKSASYYKNEFSYNPDHTPDINPTKQEETTESPIAYTCLGKGYLGYVGFVNGEVELPDIVLAMLRL